jgi:hypothetical protein
MTNIEFFSCGAREPGLRTTASDLLQVLHGLLSFTLIIQVTLLDQRNQQSIFLFSLSIHS